jgi:hypothetical protein
MNNKFLGMAAVASAAALIIMAVAGSVAPQQAFALQVVGQRNQAGGNTQTGLVNVGNAQVQVGANVCAIAENC